MPIAELMDQLHVVTGAASGIGRAAAIRLAELGAVVACLDMNLDGAQDTSEIARNAGGRSSAVSVDLVDQRTVREAISGILAQHGPISALINSAGVTGQTGMKVHEVDPTDFDRVYATNVRGALQISQAVLPSMLDQQYGRILHIASISGKEGNEGMAAYSSSKAGLIGLVKVMGKEYAKDGITVNALAPAVIQTPMVDALPQRQVDYMTAKIPMGRTGTLDEVADMIAWVVSPRCSFVTGFVFDLSGGRASY